MDQILGYSPINCQFKLGVDGTYQCTELPVQDHLCIFHTIKLSNAEKKDLLQADRSAVREVEIQFVQKLHELIELRESAPEYDRIDLRGYRFPKIEFPKLFSKTLDLTQAVFFGECSFENTEFKEHVRFQLTTFLADVSFQGTKFRKKADFYMATFGKKGNAARASFHNATFEGGATFTAASFSDFAQFSGTTFGNGGPAMFQNTTFTDDAAFVDATFNYQTIFRSKFQRESFFDRAVFNSQAKFAESTFDKSAHFVKAKFRFPDFSKSRFNDECSFIDAEFVGSTDLTNCIFNGPAEFGGSTFKQHVNFSLSEFGKDTSFFRSLFQSKALFRMCNFKGEAKFYWAVFNNDADLSGATFSMLAEFSNSVFGKAVDFSYANFLEEGRFVDTETTGCFRDEADFRHLNRGNRVSLIFKNVNLGKARFINTDLGGGTFSNIQWLRQAHKLAPWTSRPSSLWDEFRRPHELETDDYEAIAENYRQLVLNYEQKRDYESAESFHIGEMEMRRKKKAAGIARPSLRRIREWVNSYGIYRASNHYGTSYGQALVTLLTLLLILSLAFLYSGFRTVGDPKRIIEYNIFASQNHHYVSKGAWINDFSSATSLSASILTFQKDRFYEPLEGISRLWLFLGVIILTAQAAMVLLAVRRRFKR